MILSLALDSAHFLFTHFNVVELLRFQGLGDGLLGFVKVEKCSLHLFN